MMAGYNRRFLRKTNGPKLCRADFRMMIIDIQRMARLIPEGRTIFTGNPAGKGWRIMREQYRQHFPPDVKVALYPADIMEQGTAQKH